MFQKVQQKKFQLAYRMSEWVSGHVSNKYIQNNSTALDDDIVRSHCGYKIWI